MSFSIFSHPKFLGFAATESGGRVAAERRLLEGRGAGGGWPGPSAGALSCFRGFRASAES